MSRFPRPRLEGPGDPATYPTPNSSKKPGAEENPTSNLPPPAAWNSGVLSPEVASLPLHPRSGHPQGGNPRGPAAPPTARPRRASPPAAQAAVQMAAAERGEPRGALSASLPRRSTYRRSGRPWAWRAWTQGGSGRQRRAPKRRRAGRGLASRAHRALRSPESTRFSKWRFGQESGNAAANQGHELELARAGGGNGMEEAGRGGSGAFAGNPGSKTGRGSPGVAPQLTEGRARGRLSPAHGAWRGGESGLQGGVGRKNARGPAWVLSPRPVPGKEEAQSRTWEGVRGCWSRSLQTSESLSTLQYFIEMDKKYELIDPM